MADSGGSVSKLSSSIPSLIPASLPVPAKVQEKWNTKKLGMRLAADLASALTAGALVAPLIAIIDRSIMENASGRKSLSTSVRASFNHCLTNPISFLTSKPPQLILLAYAGTFLTANLVDTATSTIRNAPAEKVTHGTNKFIASSFANISLGIYKDQVFTRMFGPKDIKPRPVSAPSYLLFTLRDCMTIFASFNVPPLLAPYLDAKMGKEVSKVVGGQTVAQFVAPAAIQVFSTPLHLLGLDMYNRPSKGSGGVLGWGERWEQVRKNWAVSAGARVCRIVPAFGVGGVVNLKTRQALMRHLA